MPVQTLQALAAVMANVNRRDSLSNDGTRAPLPAGVRLSFD